MNNQWNNKRQFFRAGERIVPADWKCSLTNHSIIFQKPISNIKNHEGCEVLPELQVNKEKNNSAS